MLFDLVSNIVSNPFAMIVETIVLCGLIKQRILSLFQCSLINTINQNNLLLTCDTSVKAGAKTFYHLKNYKLILHNYL